MPPELVYACCCMTTSLLMPYCRQPFTVPCAFHLQDSAPPELVVEVLRGCNGSAEAATEALFAMLQGARTQPAASVGQGSVQLTHGEACNESTCSLASGGCCKPTAKTGCGCCLVLGMQRHRCASASSAL